MIYDRIFCVYMGLTDQKICQRFDAHIPKFTAVRNHHHPKRWRDYVESRFNAKGNYFEDLNEFKLGFYDLLDFRFFLEEETDRDLVNEIEALVFYGTCITNRKERFLNEENKVSTKQSRENWKRFFRM